MDRKVFGGVEMNFLDAVKAMKEGKKVRSIKFDKGKYWYIKGGYIYDWEGGLVGSPRIVGYINDDWEVVKEKKTLSDNIVNYYTNDKGYLCIDDVREALLDFNVWITTEHAPDKSSPAVLEKAKKIFGERLLEGNDV